MALRNSVMGGGVMKSKEFSDLEGGSVRRMNENLSLILSNSYLLIGTLIFSCQSVDQSIKQQK